MGITLPFAHIFLDEPNFLHEVGVEGTKGLVQLSQYGPGGGNPSFKTPEQIKYYKTWNNLWKTKWTAPFNTRLYEHGTGNFGSYIMQTYWLLSVMERAKSTGPEKIIKLWEGDSYQFVNGKILTMRPCDHKAIQDLHIFEFVPPEQQKVFQHSALLLVSGLFQRGADIHDPRRKGASPYGPETWIGVKARTIGGNS